MANGTKASDGDPSQPESFELMIERLEAIVGRLEKGELSLEDSLRAYEEGVGLVRRAQGCLDGMDRRLEQLTVESRIVPLGGDGKIDVAREPDTGSG